MKNQASNHHNYDGNNVFLFPLQQSWMHFNVFHSLTNGVCVAAPYVCLLTETSVIAS